MGDFGLQGIALIDLLDQAGPLLLEGPTRHRRWDLDQRLNPCAAGLRLRFLPPVGCGGEHLVGHPGPELGDRDGKPLWVTSLGKERMLTSFLTNDRK